MNSELYRSTKTPHISVQTFMYNNNDAEMLFYCFRCDGSRGRVFSKDVEIDFAEFEKYHQKCVAQLTDDEATVFMYLSKKENETAMIKDIAQAIGYDDNKVQLILKSLYSKNVIQPLTK